MSILLFKPGPGLGQQDVGGHRRTDLAVDFAAVLPLKPRVAQHSSRRQRCNERQTRAAVLRLTASKSSQSAGRTIYGVNGQFPGPRIKGVTDNGARPHRKPYPREPAQSRSSDFAHRTCRSSRPAQRAYGAESDGNRTTAVRVSPWRVGGQHDIKTRLPAATTARNHRSSWYPRSPHGLHELRRPTRGWSASIRFTIRSSILATRTYGLRLPRCPSRRQEPLSPVDYESNGTF